MSLAQAFYAIYLRILAIPLILCLFLVKWKKLPIESNLGLLGIAPTPLFRFRFYLHASLDALRFAHRNYGRAIRIRNQDETKLERMRTGPALLLSAHFHNWELMGGWLTRSKGVPLLSVALPLRSLRFQRLLKRLRTHQANPVTENNVTRTAIRHLREGKCLGMLWDQYPVQSRLLAPFFGIPVKVEVLPSFLAAHSQAPVFFAVLLPRGQFRLVQLTAPSTHPIIGCRLAQRYHRVLEIVIKAYPDYWYGLAHRRFKDQVPYEIFRSVSRETTSRFGPLVSRETKISPPIR